MGSEGSASNVLIVEDQPLIALSIEDVLRDLGCTVTHAATVAEALIEIERASWDAALLDVRLADGTVYPVAELLQSKAIPFAFATGSIDEIDARFSGAPVLTKPFGHNELEACLNALLAQKPHAPRAA